MKNKGIRSEQVLPTARRQLATEIHLFSVASAKGSIEAPRLLPRRAPNQRAKADGSRHIDRILIIFAGEQRVQTFCSFSSRQGIGLGEPRKAGNGGVVGEGRHRGDRIIARRMMLQALQPIS